MDSGSYRGVLRFSIVMLAAALLTTCEAGEGPPLGVPADSTEAETLEAGEVQVEVVTSDPDAGPGSTVEVSVRVRRGDEAPTPTGFVASLRYDPGALSPLEDVSPEGGGNALRVVNLEADAGEVKAAGAAPDGFATEELFAVKMEVEDAGWTNGLRLRLHDLDVVENDVAEVSGQVETRIRPSSGM